MVDRPYLARAIADIRDAVERIREVLPADAATFAGDRTAREVVVLNLFVALQQVFSLGTKWLADEGRDVPESHRDVLQGLADLGVLTPDLFARLQGSAGLRNLIAHRYAALDWARIHEVASADLGDLEAFCQAIGRAVDDARD